jgi:hypothetical protein
MSVGFDWFDSGGPEIAFRGGRIDAGEPNIPGVPEPQQDLDSHIAAFARQGFTQTEMIKLVACGYVFVSTHTHSISTQRWQTLVRGCGTRAIPGHCPGDK